MGLVRFILIILIIYITFRLFMRYVAPWLLRFFIKKAVQKTQQYQQERSFNKPPPSKPPKSFDEGEYIDFEEVK